MGLHSVQDRHRPGAFKQQNKAHKHGRHRSKGAIDNAIKGRTSVKTFTKKARHELRRGERRNKAAQIRQKKRDEVLFKKRSLGGATSAPLLIAVVPLCDNIDCTRAVELLKQADPEAVVTHSCEGIMHISVPRFKQRFSVMIALPGCLSSTLDALKVADTTLFLVSACQQNGIDEVGEKILISCLAQGLPSTVVAVVDLDSLPLAKQHEGMQNIQKAISSWLPDEKIMALSRHTDGLAVLRRAGSQKQRYIKHRNIRPYILAEVIDYTPDVEGCVGTLKVMGYVRGQPLCVNSLVHIPGWGDFQMSRIDAPDDPHPLEKGRKASKEDVCTGYMNRTMDEDERILEIADPGKQESLQSENIPDPMENEQTWPTEEELLEAEEESRVKKRRIKKVPRGMSEYQAAWIPDSDAEEVDIAEEDECDMKIDVEASSEENSSDGEHTEEGECDTVTVTDFGTDAERYDEKMDFTEEEEALNKIKDAQMEQLFPDELDTPKDIPARLRFQKYRGLKSFRTSAWDPKENLPSEYARIFQFENFDRTCKKIMRGEDKEGAMPGCYVTVHINGVPESLNKARQLHQPLVLVGLLPHEQKMSVLNFVIRRPNVDKHNQLIIKSKEQLIFHCGYRRFKACPIFSQHTNGTKHKYERFFQPGASVVASVFAPIMFPPSPVLVYKLKRDCTQELVATGHLLSVNPDRIVAKRVILSGYLFKIMKRSAVVRFMFFNREDIDWFKPVELRTKHGRRGHIREPLGTHGHMKCVFDGQLKSQDTVLMNIYKRVFPKWTYEHHVNSAPSMYSTLSIDSE